MFKKVNLKLYSKTFILSVRHRSSNSLLQDSSVHFDQLTNCSFVLNNNKHTALFYLLAIVYRIELTGLLLATNNTKKSILVTQSLLRNHKLQGKFSGFQLKSQS